MAVPAPRLYPGSARHAPTLALLGIGAFLVSTALVGNLGGMMSDAAFHRSLSRVLIVLWGLVPPAWFLLEHFYVFPKFGDGAATFEQLRGRQSVLTKAWVAAVATLGLLYWQALQAA